MTSRSNPDWLNELIAEEGDAKLIDVHERDDLLEALEAATDPRPLDAEHNRKLLENVLGGKLHMPIHDGEDPLAPATNEERAAAEVTRRNLESNPVVALLRAANGPCPLTPDMESAIRRAALSQPPRKVRSARSHTAVLSWSALAVAAAAVLWLAVPAADKTEPFLDNGMRGELAQSRTTRHLFAQSFASSTPSERIDRIAQLRQRELRDNRYVLWGLP